jgi:ribosome biogenesis protein ERB1
MSKRRRSGTTETESDQNVAAELNIDPAAVVSEDEDSESGSEESAYSDLSSELDTEPEEAEEDEEQGSIEGGKERRGGGEDEGEVDEKERFAKSWLEAEETDTSDEEEVRNTVGNIPLEWYEDYPHLGYDLGGQRIAKPLKRDEVGPAILNWRSPLAVSGASWRSIWPAWRTLPTGGQ